MTPGWVDWPTPNDEGLWKYDRHGIGARPSGRGGGRDAVFNNGVDPQLRIMERLGEMTAAAHSKNLRCPLAADGREICLRFHSKVDCVRSCTRSHPTVRGQSRDHMLRYIGICRVDLDLSKKMKFNRGWDWGSCGGHWERDGGNGTRQNSGRQNYGSGA